MVHVREIRPLPTTTLFSLSVVSLVEDGASTNGREHVKGHNNK